MSCSVKPVETGGPAFPSPGRLEQNPYSHLPHFVRQGDSSGMSLRDYFAAKAITGCLPGSESSVEDKAAWAYRMADAMLKARSS